MNDMVDKIQELYKEIAMPLVAIIGGAALLLGVWMGSNFLLAGGDPEKLKKAKAQVKYYIIAWIVIFATATLTPGLIEMLKNWFQG